MHASSISEQTDLAVLDEETVADQRTGVEHAAGTDDHTYETVVGLQSRYRCYEATCIKVSEAGRFWVGSKDTGDMPLFYTPLDLKRCSRCGRYACQAHFKDGQCTECRTAMAQGTARLLLTVLCTSLLIMVLILGLFLIL